MSTPPWIARREAATQATSAYLKSGRSRWIDIALDEGWSSILRDWVQATIYEHARVDGVLPTLARVDQIFSNIDRGSHEAALRSRVAINACIEREIRVARGMAEAAPYVPTADLIGQLKDEAASDTSEADMPSEPVDVSRPAFQAMQRQSPNRYLHRQALTLRSRAMQGDRE